MSQARPVVNWDYSGGAIGSGFVLCFGEFDSLPCESAICSVFQPPHALEFARISADTLSRLERFLVSVRHFQAAKAPSARNN